LFTGEARRYVQYFNWHYKRTGTLWEGRYRATIVDAENYLFECMRYIELNPVRAGMVARPRQYSWSSYRCNAEGRTDPLVSQHSLYRGLAREENERQGAYRTLVKATMDAQTIDTIRTCTNKGWALGSGKFQSKIERVAERRAAPMSKGRPKSIKAD
jgi:putative transposase